MVAAWGLTARTKGALLITGASTGIGASCALRMDSRGYQVFAGVRKAGDGEALEQKASDRLSHVILDVTDRGTIACAAQTVADTVGDRGIIGLVNNAGIVVAGPLEFVPIEGFRRQLDTNVVGPIAVTQAFLPLLRRGNGRVVNVGSIFGRLALPFLGPYSASKSALKALTDALRLELRPWNIQVSIVEPGAISTPIWDKSRLAAEAMATPCRQDIQHFYGKTIDAFLVAMERLAKTAISPEAVADAIEHALTAARPKTRYLVGADARRQAIVARFLPDRFRDLLIRKVLGLPKP